MKTVFSVLVLLAASVICFSDAFGQVYVQEHLPEGVKARIGKMSIFETDSRVRCCEPLRDM